MKTLLPATLAAPAVVALLALWSGCTDTVPEHERPLAEMPALTAIVDVDVGVPTELFTAIPTGSSVSLFIDYAATDACYTLAPTTVATVDGLAPDAFVTGGFDAVDAGEASCTKPALYVTDPPAPRDISTISLADATATYSLSIARLFVNPRITIPATLAVGQAVATIDDPRPISAATIWWRSADGTQSWMKAADASTQGELRFTIPPSTSGTGTLGITLTIRDSPVIACQGFASCKAIVRGGGAFAVTVE